MSDLSIEDLLNNSNFLLPSDETSVEPIIEKDPIVLNSKKKVSIVYSNKAPISDSSSSDLIEPENSFKPVECELEATEPENSVEPDSIACKDDIPVEEAVMKPQMAPPISLDDLLAEVKEKPIKDITEFHPIANIFPMIQDGAFKELVEDIKVNGLVESIEVYENKILDGRNRFEACKVAGIKPSFKEYDGNDPLSYVISKNLKRRHLSESQRGMIVNNISEMYTMSNNESICFARLEKLARKKEIKEINESKLSYNDKQNSINYLKSIWSRSDITNNKRKNRKIYIAYDGEKIKIGVSSYPNSRINDLKIGNPKLELLKEYDGDFNCEEDLKKLLLKFHIDKEYYQYSDEIMEKIDKYFCTANLQYRKPTQNLPSLTKLFNVSERTVYDARMIKKEAPDKVEDIVTGKKTIHEVKKELRTEEIKQERKKIADKAKSLPNTEKFCIELGDIRTYKTDKTFDFIITDPPYPYGLIDLYGFLAQRANEWLNPGGLLIAMCGQSYLDKIYKLMSEHMDYYWTACYHTPGQPTPLRQKNVNTTWKPLLMFTKKTDKYKGKIFGDFFVSDGNDKSLHKWGQSESGMYSIVSSICLPGQSIMDPFCGAGTTGVAALKHDCLFHGVDIDEEYVKISKGRLYDIIA